MYLGIYFKYRTIKYRNTELFKTTTQNILDPSQSSKLHFEKPRLLSTEYLEFALLIYLMI